MASALAFPFLEEFIQELLHNFMAVLRQLFASLGKHTVFEKQKFFVKMINSGACIVFIGFKCGMLLRLTIGIVHRATLSPPICKCSANTYSTDGIQLIGIVNNSPFNGVKFCFNQGSLKVHVAQYVLNVLDNDIINTQTSQPLTGRPGAGFLVAIVELEVGNVMQKSCQFQSEHIYTIFSGRNMLCKLPNAIHMPIIMAGAFSTELIFKKILGLENDFCLSHALILAEEPQRKWCVARRESNYSQQR